MTSIIELKNFKTKNLEVKFVGHSMGGVIAKLASLYFNLLGSNHKCITYSQF